MLPPHPFREYNGLAGGVRVRVVLLFERSIPMNEILEVLYAYAAVATIGSFLFDLWTEYKEHGRSREGTRGKLK